MGPPNADAEASLSGLEAIRFMTPRQGLHDRASALGEGEARPEGSVSAMEEQQGRQPSATKKRVSEPGRAGTLTSDSRPPELGESRVLLCTSLSPWYFVTVARQTDADLFSSLISK